jgi:hypothetical protein
MESARTYLEVLCWGLLGEHYDKASKNNLNQDLQVPVSSGCESEGLPRLSQSHILHWSTKRTNACELYQFAGICRVSRGQRHASPQPYSRLSRPQPLLLHPSSSSIVVTQTHYFSIW